MSSKEALALAAHLMRRAGFGVSRGELERCAAQGYEATVEELLNPGDRPGGKTALLQRYVPGYASSGPTAMGAPHWLYHMITTQRPLEEKMALFWHHVFATGNSKVDNSCDVLEQIEMLREYGMSNYRELLAQLARNPAMIFWLDNNENHRRAVNENWGRELLELFSMGVSNYTEVDVREVSRAFTGWTMAAKLPRTPYGRFNWRFQYKEEDHDDSEKTFLGQTGKFNGDDVIDIIVERPATARFICRHLYNFFVADEPQVPAWTIEPAQDEPAQDEPAQDEPAQDEPAQDEPAQDEPAQDEPAQDEPAQDEPALATMVQSFIESGYEIKAVLRTMFLSDFFQQARFAKIKSPAEVVAGTLILTGAFQLPEPGLLEIAREPGYMGQSIIDPPSVEGWHTGTEWINSGSLLARINFVADQVANSSLPGVKDIVRQMKADGVATPEELIDACLEYLGFVQLRDETRAQLLEHVGSSGNLDWRDETAAGNRIGEVMALIGATTEYQFA